MNGSVGGIRRRLPKACSRHRGAWSVFGRRCAYGSPVRLRPGVRLHNQMAETAFPK